MELIPAYAYGEEPIIFFRKADQRLSSSSSIEGKNASTGDETSRRGYVYKFYSSEGTLNLVS